MTCRRSGVRVPYRPPKKNRSFCCGSFLPKRRDSKDQIRRSGGASGAAITGGATLHFCLWQKCNESLIVHHEIRHRLARCLVLCIEGKGLEQGGGAAATDTPVECRLARGRVPYRPPKKYRSFCCGIFLPMRKGLEQSVPTLRGTVGPPAGASLIVRHERNLFCSSGKRGFLLLPPTKYGIIMPA